MDAIQFRTSSQGVDVPWGQAQALLRWLYDREDGRPAAEAIENREPAGVLLTTEQKQVVLDEIRARLAIEGTDVVGPELLDLRDALMRDLDVPPFDVEPRSSEPR